MNAPTQPHDLDAERAVLGAMMLSPDAVKAVEGMLRPEDFYDQRHGLVFETIRGLRKQNRPVDAVQVKADLQASGEISRLGSPAFLFALIEVTPMPSSATHYAKIVRDRAILREVITAAARMTQMAYQPGEPADQLVDQAYDIIGKIRMHGIVDDLSDTVAVEEFLSQELPAADWVLPGLLTRGNRLLVTGSEGLGKSMLIRQMAVCAAAGVHPFTGKPIDPKKVLVIDCENPEDLTHEWYSSLLAAARQAGYPVPEGRLFLNLQGAGLDLLMPEDVRWLMHRVEVFCPDLLVIGPIYKLHMGNPNDEETARLVAAVLDKARLANGRCALIAETHAPHNSGFDRERPLRPYGASLWMRWPDFGFGLRYVKSKDEGEQRAIAEARLVEIKHWRGARTERDWPRRLRRGGTWPWTLPTDELLPSDQLAWQDRAAGERGEDPWANGGRLT